MEEPPSLTTSSVRRVMAKAQSINITAHQVVALDNTFAAPRGPNAVWLPRSEEHTSELQSQSNLVCRLLLEKKQCTEHPTVPTASAAGDRNIVLKAVSIIL